MGRVVPHPGDLFDEGRRHMVLYAHQDDELPSAGIIDRMGPDVRLLWLTNGDGLAPREKADPTEYAEMRTAESRAAMACLGASEDRLEFLGHSELEIYDLLAGLSEDATGANGVPARFQDMADEVLEHVLTADPEVLWTQAWQGGHPEHDLIHLYAQRARKVLTERRGQPVPLFEFPAYEFTFLVPLRFRPWRGEPYHAITIDDAAMAKKLAMFDCYPSQLSLLDDFRKLISLYGRVSWLRLNPFTFQDFARREVFGTVPPDRDYSRSTHAFEWLDYMFDDFEGRPIRFGRTLPRIAASLGL